MNHCVSLMGPWKERELLVRATQTSQKYVEFMREGLRRVLKCQRVGREFWAICKWGAIYHVCGVVSGLYTEITFCYRSEKDSSLLWSSALWVARIFDSATSYHHQ